MKMSLTTNVQAVVKRNDLRVRNLKRQMQRASKDVEKLVHEKALEYSGLTDHSLTQLAKMGHPYSKRHPKPPHDPAYLHAQSGNLRKSWELTVEFHGSDYVLTLRNKAEYFKWLEGGTKKMIRRPILEAISASTIKPIRERNKEALNKALSTGR